MTAYTKALARLVNAMPRSIRFPYGEQAYGLTTYCAIPKHGKRIPTTYAQRLTMAVQSPAIEKVW